MKRIIFAAVAAAFLMAAIVASAQTPKRLKFAKGEASITIKGKTGQNGVYYVVRLRAGQIFTVRLSPASNIRIKVKTKGINGPSEIFDKEKGGTYTKELIDTGDYTIFIGSNNRKNTSFTLKLMTIY